MSLPVPLINRERAESVLGAFGVSALVLSDATNIYHATGFWPQTLAMGHLGTSFAVVPADRAQPVALVTSQFVHYFFDLDDAPDDGPLRMFLYTAPDGAEGAMPPSFFRGAEDSSPDPFEQTSRASTVSLLAGRPPTANATTALRAALANADIHGALAVDSFLPQAVLGDDFSYRPAEPPLRRIRMIKSAAEIALMRHAARNNAEAAYASVQAMTRGDTHEDLRRAFFAETGRRGGVPLFLQIDNIAYSQRDGVIREGRAFLIDAVSRYAGYHGDYGRTVFVGPADPPIRRAVDAAIAANDAVAKALRPGLLYSDVSRIGRKAIEEAGYDVNVASGPHSVGLFHTDEAFLDDAQTFAKADHLMEKDMVLSIDCPALQTDAGGSVHLEDLWLVTEDGCEALNDRAHPFIQI